jgi:predicted TPR repeat methyltransferase
MPAQQGNPDQANVLVSRGMKLLEMGRGPEAVAAFDLAVAAAPDDAAAWYHRGNALLVSQRVEDALASYERALAIQPQFPAADNNRHAALFALGRAVRCPPSYIRRTFDEFAGHYDETMLDRLGYRGHTQLRHMADAVLPRDGGPWRILDLGSGTGLVGEAFKDLARGGRLHGIDLSPRMTEAARRRGIYDELIVGDVETILASPGHSYNMVLAADTMSYFGDLARVFSGVATRLEPGGFFLFAVESMPGESWELTARKTFRHSETYMRKAAEAAGFVVVRSAELHGDWTSGSRTPKATVLHEGRVPVTGLVFALRIPG